jgi:hypothetical protein
MSTIGLRFEQNKNIEGGWTMRTRGDLLRFAIAFALRSARKLVRGLREGLTEEERFRIADDVVHQLEQRGDPWATQGRIAAAWAGDIRHPLEVFFRESPARGSNNLSLSRLKIITAKKVGGF